MFDRRHQVIFLDLDLLSLLADVSKHFFRSVSINKVFFRGGQMFSMPSKWKHGGAGGNKISVNEKVIVVWIWYELPFSIWSISIYYGTQSDIRVKSYCGLNLLRVSIFNFERLDILWDLIGNPSKKLFWFAFVTRFCFQFRASRYITGLNRKSE